MKKIFLILIAMGIVVITTSFIPENSNIVAGNDNFSANAIPDDVKAIIEKSCIGCHSDDSKGLGKSKVNFSKWDTYDAKKQASKSKAICKAITKGKMPPKKTRESKPELIPTQAELDLVCKWAQSF
jgi:uncharacterized membrane protein